MLGSRSTAKKESPAWGLQQTPPKARKPRPVVYPERDGKPLGETTIHARELIEIVAALWHHFRHVKDIFIFGDIMLYFEEGNPHKVCSPDIGVTLNRPRGERRVYKTWEEGNPDILIELTSKKTKKEDFIFKRELYEQTLKVYEYLMFDPTGDYLKPSLQLLRLQRGQYQQVQPDAEGWFYSEVLDLSFRGEGDILRMKDAKTHELLLRRLELADLQEQLQEEKTWATKKAEQQTHMASEAKSRADTFEVLARQESVRAAEAEARAVEVEARLQAEASRAAEVEARLQAEAQAKAAELEARLQAEAQAKAAELEARLQAEARATEVEARLHAEAQAKAAEFEARLHAEARAAEVEARLQAEASRAAEVEARLQAEAQARAALLLEVEQLKKMLATQR